MHICIREERKERNTRVCSLGSLPKEDASIHGRATVMLDDKDHHHVHPSEALLVQRDKVLTRHGTAC